MKHWLLALTIIVLSAGASAGDCVKLSEVCSEGPSAKVINGVSVFRECWHYKALFDCRSDGQISDCQALRDQACTQTGTSCVARLDDGSCVSSAQTYSCPDKPASVSERTICEQSSFCSDGSPGCFDTSSPVDRDFGVAAAAMEAAREAGVYGVSPDKIEIFKGYENQCSVKVLGGGTIKSCCAATHGGGVSNNEFLRTAGAVAVDAGGEALKAGSKYVYDALYQNLDEGLLKQGLSAMGSSLSGAPASSTFGAYGFQFSFSFTEGFTMTGFDPASFAISVGLMLIQQWLACDQSEQAMSLRRGQNLCAYVDTYCSSKVLGVCIERKERHCCFNSVLAKLINRQGRAQVGLPMNQCGGFNQAQIQALNIAAMDLSEFIDTIVPKALDQSAITNKAGQAIQERVIHYYEQ